MGTCTLAERIISNEPAMTSAALRTGAETAAKA
jgi:hypothetical protein